MNKRTFLKLGIGGLVLGGIGLAFRAPDGALRTHAHTVISEHLKHGDMTASGVDQFVSDIENAPYVTYQAKGLVYVLSKMTNAPNEPVSNEFLEDFRVKFNRQIISDYLLSSDFFLANKGPGSTVAYIGFKNRLCAQSNPFAQFLDS
jgi:hypothetical protein